MIMTSLRVKKLKKKIPSDPSRWHESVWLAGSGLAWLEWLPCLDFLTGSAWLAAGVGLAWLGLAWLGVASLACSAWLGLASPGLVFLGVAWLWLGLARLGSRYFH